MTRIKKNKIVNPSFAHIEKLGSKKNLIITLPDSNKTQLEFDMWKLNNEIAFEMPFEINGTLREVDSYLDKIFNDNTVSFGDQTYSFLSQALGNLSFNLKTGKIKGRLKSLIESTKADFNGKFLRMVQTFSTIPKIGTFSESIDLETDQEVLYGVGIISIVIQGKRFDVFRISVEKQNYCFIDSTQEIELDQFDKICSSVFYAYSYLFGYNVGEEAYILSSNEPTFNSIEHAIFISKPKSSEHGFQIFDSMELRSIGISPDFYNFPLRTLSNLCQKILIDNKFLRLINLINEANLNKYSYSSCILFSVALETISGLIVSNSNPQPIDTKRFDESDIINQLQNTIEKNETLNEIDKEFLINKKIKTLNKPTNTDKFNSPFELLNIKLPEPFKKVLKYRDKYLHGSAPKNSTEKSDDYVNFIKAYELQFVVNVLTLKSLGYSGYLRNTNAFIELYSQQEQKFTPDEIRLTTSLYYLI